MNNPNEPIIKSNESLLVLVVSFFYKFNFVSLSVRLDCLLLPVRADKGAFNTVKKIEN